MLRLSILMLLAGFLATIGCGNGADNNIGQVLIIDGPGGYLPDASSMIGDINSNMIFDNGNMAFGSGKVFALYPSASYDKFMLFPTAINFGDMWDSHWNSIFDANGFPFVSSWH